MKRHGNWKMSTSEDEWQKIRLKKRKGQTNKTQSEKYGELRRCEARKRDDRRDGEQDRES